jgi:hypothetical protein
MPYAHETHLSQSAMERGQSKPKPYAQPRPPQRGSNHTMETIEETVQDKDVPFDPFDGKGGCQDQASG